MKGLQVTLSSLPSTNDVELYIINLSDQCYNIDTTYLMLDKNVKFNNFVVIDKEDRHELPYQGTISGFEHIYMEIEPGEIIKSETINLDEFYNIEFDKSYGIYYRSILPYTACDDYEHTLWGYLESNHIVTPHDLLHNVIIPVTLNLVCVVATAISILHSYDETPHTNL